MYVEWGVELKRNQSGIADIYLGNQNLKMEGGIRMEMGRKGVNLSPRTGDPLRPP